MANTQMQTPDERLMNERQANVGKAGPKQKATAPQIARRKSAIREKIIVAAISVLSGATGAGVAAKVVVDHEKAKTPVTMPAECPETPVDARTPYLENLAKRFSYGAYFAADPADPKKDILTEEEKAGMRKQLIESFKLTDLMPEITPDNYDLLPASPNSISAISKDKIITAVYADKNNKKIKFTMDVNTGKAQLVSSAPIASASGKSAGTAEAEAKPANNPDAEFDKMNRSEVERLANSREPVVPPILRIAPGGPLPDETEEDYQKRIMEDEKKRTDERKAREARFERRQRARDYVHRHGWDTIQDVPTRW